MGNRLFVGNISFRATPDMLRSEFGAFGEVSDVYLPTDRETGRMRGFAFVTMESDAGAQAAIAGMNGKPLEGRPLVVNEARPAPAGGGGGGGGGDRPPRGPGGGGGFRGPRSGGGGGGGGGGRGGYGGGGGQGY
jgi:RNA recognition motif-containing protein